MSIIGFDLGTSQSAGCYLAGKFHGKEVYAEVENDMVRSGTIARAENEKYFPSYVQYDGSGNAIVAGMRARLLADGFPRTTVYDSKRIIGRSFGDPETEKLRQILAARGHYEVCAAEQQCGIRVGQAVVTPEQVGGDILAGMIKDALLQEPALFIRKIVISVPAYFKDARKLKTKEAAAIAIRKVKATEFGSRIGIEVEGRQVDDLEDISLIPEPSAAFITYMARGGHKHISKGKYALVFDLGAGTLDITIGTAVVVKDPVTREDRYTLDIAMTHGNTALGGRDMDQKIVEHILAELGRRNVQADVRLLSGVGEKAELAKIDLSTRESTSIGFIEHGVTVTLTRAKLTELIAPLLAQCREEIRMALLKAGLRKGEIAAIVLVGGPTYMPCIRELVEEEVGARLSLPDQWDPMLCVAEGAARSCSVVVNEVVPFNYYVAVEMFEGVNVLSKVASIGEPANLDKKIELTVPMYNEDELNYVRLRMVEAEVRDVVLVKADCIQEVSLPLAVGPRYQTQVRTIWPRWTTRELMNIQVLPLRYGRIQMTCRMNKDGIMLRPTFFNPATGNQVTYPDLPVWNLGEVDVIDRQTFERNFEQYAQKGYVEKIESGFKRNLDLIMKTSGCIRSKAVGMIMAYAKAEAKKEPGDLTLAEREAMAQSREEKAAELRRPG